MEGRFLHFSTENDTNALRRLLLDLQNGNPYGLLRWRAKEQELLEALETAHPYGHRFKGIRAWVPEEWLKAFFRYYQ